MESKNPQLEVSDQGIELESISTEVTGQGIVAQPSEHMELLPTQEADTLSRVTLQQTITIWQRLVACM